MFEPGQRCFGQRIGETKCDKVRSILAFDARQIASCVPSCAERADRPVPCVGGKNFVARVFDAAIQFFRTRMGHERIMSELPESSSEL